jgi:hypothetical protein
MRRDITFLASDRCEGRGVATKGINLAADYVVDQFRQAGLKPGGTDGSYFQPFTMPGATLGSPNTLRFRGPGGEVLDSRLDEQFQPLGLAYSGKVSARILFAGYGISTGGDPRYDDFDGVDAEGKVVIILRGRPHAGSGKSIDRNAGSLTAKIANAEKHGAIAVLFVNDRDTARDGDDLLNFGYTATSVSPAKLPLAHVRRALVDDLLKASLKKGLKELEDEIDKTLHPASAPLPDWRADLEVSVHHGNIPVKNVLGVLEGTGPLANETVVIGAHYDHLGYGGPGSLANLMKPAIHHGADDNASGTTALMELARRFAAQQSRSGRRLVFIAFSGEESGLLGSQYYCKHPIFPLESTVAMVNMDMVGRLRQDRQGPMAALVAVLTPVPEGELPLIVPLAAAAKGNANNYLTFKDRLIVYGTGTSAGFDRLIESVNDHFGFKLRKVPGGTGPSDHASFYEKKVPVFFFFTDDHEDYHKPTDTADKINVAGMNRVADMVQELVTQLEETSERPRYVKVKGESGDFGRYQGMPRLGFRPGNYGETDGGVLVGGLIEGGAAARAGLKEGDRIIAIAGKPVTNMMTYMNLMAAQKKGKPLEVTVSRGGNKLTIVTTPD